MKTQMNLLAIGLYISTIALCLVMSIITSPKNNSNDALPMLEVQLPTIVVKETSISKSTDNEIITAYKNPKSELDNFR